MNDKQRGGNDNKPQRAVHETLTREASGIIHAVIIHKTDGFRPRYSVSIGQMYNNIFKPFVQIHPWTEQGKTTFEATFDPQVFADLLAEAKQKIEWLIYQRETDIMEQMISREKRQLERDKPRQRPGLKELTKRDKAHKKQVSQEGGETT